MYRSYTLIGLGGIGSNLLPNLIRLLSFTKGEEDVTLYLVDGDTVEEKNLARQGFTQDDIGFPKVEALVQQVDPQEIRVESCPYYINDENVASLIRDNSVVILAVDNNKTRKLVQEHCLKLKNCVIVNGGNDIYDGDVTAFQIEDGVIKYPPIWEGQEQIINPTDNHPEDSCEERYESYPQLFATNVSVASSILNFLTPLLLKGKILWRRNFFDIRSGSRVESELTVPQLIHYDMQ